MSLSDRAPAPGDRGVFRIRRDADPGTYRLTDLFPDIRNCAVLAEIFPAAGEIERTLSRIRTVVAEMPHEMFVDNRDGTITIGLNHLRSASDTFLYLDIFHELFHVRQQGEGRDLYDRSRAYVDRETEIEAYRLTVREARRIGLDDGAIACYLRVSWITEEEHGRLLRTLGVSPGAPSPPGS